MILAETVRFQFLPPLGLVCCLCVVSKPDWIGSRILITPKLPWLPYFVSCASFKYSTIHEEVLPFDLGDEDSTPVRSRVLGLCGCPLRTCSSFWLSAEPRLSQNGVVEVLTLKIRVFTTSEYSNITDSTTR